MSLNIKTLTCVQQSLDLLRLNLKPLVYLIAMHLNYTKDPDTELITDLKIWNILKTNQCKLNQIKNWKIN